MDEQASVDGENRETLAQRSGFVGVVLVLGTLATLSAIAFALSEGGGALFRRVGLVETNLDPKGSFLQFEDGAQEALGFLADRDTLRFAVPWAMSTADLLALYHLENNPAARLAIEDAVGSADEEALIPEGMELTIPLTPTRANP